MSSLPVPGLPWHTIFQPKQSVLINFYAYRWNSLENIIHSYNNQERYFHFCVLSDDISLHCFANIQRFGKYIYEIRLTFLKKQNFIDITVDAHALVRNNRERAHVPLIQFSPMRIFFKTIVRYHHLGINSYTIHLFYSDFPSFTCTCADLYTI